MILPEPSLYGSWQEWARALMVELQKSEHLTRLRSALPRAWREAQYQNGWGAGLVQAEYLLFGGVVYFRGDAMHAGPSGGQAMFVLDPGCRPENQLEFVCGSAGFTGAAAYLSVNTDGSVVWNSGAAWVSLAGISFPVEAKRA